MSGGTVQRVRSSHVDWLLDRLSDRDRRIVREISRVRLLTSQQLERLCFADLSGRSRSIVRARVLKRLTDWRVLVMLPRRVGGRGSSAAVYCLDSAGWLLLRLGDEAHEASARRPGLPGERFMRHVLAVSELYVSLVEADRSGMLTLLDFRAEPASWVADGLGGWLKPDAFISIGGNGLVDDYFAEVDLATEHLPTIRRKADAYVSFYKRGQLGPNGVMPKVLFTVPDEHRKAAVQAMLDRLPIQGLFHVATLITTVPHLVQVLRE